MTSSSRSTDEVGVYSSDGSSESQRDTLSILSSQSESYESYQDVDNDEIDMSRVVDVVSFSTTILYACVGGIIYIHRGCGYKQIDTNIEVHRFEKYMGYLYAISYGRLHVLDTSTLNDDKLVWTLCSWSIKDIVHSSSTTSGDHLLLQSKSRACMYNDKFQAQELDIASGYRRSYGSTINSYVDYNRWTAHARLVINGSVTDLRDVCSAIISHDEKVYAISGQESKRYKEIRLINWKPVYLLTIPLRIVNEACRLGC
jgi:hypothetical protein